MKKYTIVFFNKNDAVVETIQLEAESERVLEDSIHLVAKLKNLSETIGAVRWEASTVVLTGSISK